MLYGIGQRLLRFVFEEDKNEENSTSRKSDSSCENNEQISKVRELFSKLLEQNDCEYEEMAWLAAMDHLKQNNVSIGSVASFIFSGSSAVKLQGISKNENDENTDNNEPDESGKIQEMWLNQLKTEIKTICEDVAQEIICGSNKTVILVMRLIVTKVLIYRR